jgi:hypothetical protein
VKIANIPPSTQVKSGAVKVSSMDALRAALSTCYLLQDGQLWVRLIANGQSFDPKSALNQPVGNRV